MPGSVWGHSASSLGFTAGPEPRGFGLLGGLPRMASGRGIDGSGSRFHAAHPLPLRRLISHPWKTAQCQSRCRRLARLPLCSRSLSLFRFFPFLFPLFPSFPLFPLTAGGGAGKIGGSYRLIFQPASSARRLGRGGGGARAAGGRTEIPGRFPAAAARGIGWMARRGKGVCHG